MALALAEAAALVGAGFAQVRRKPHDGGLPGLARFVEDPRVAHLSYFRINSRENSRNSQQGSLCIQQQLPLTSEVSTGSLARAAAELSSFVKQASMSGGDMWC